MLQFIGVRILILVRQRVSGDHRLRDNVFQLFTPCGRLAGRKKNKHLSLVCIHRQRALGKIDVTSSLWSRCMGNKHLRGRNKTHTPRPSRFHVRHDSHVYFRLIFPLSNHEDTVKASERNSSSFSLFSYSPSSSLTRDPATRRAAP